MASGADSGNLAPTLYPESDEVISQISLDALDLYSNAVVAESMAEEAGQVNGYTPESYTFMAFLDWLTLDTVRTYRVVLGITRRFLVPIKAQHRAHPGAQIALGPVEATCADDRDMEVYDFLNSVLIDDLDVAHTQFTHLVVNDDEDHSVVQYFVTNLIATITA